MFAHSPDTQKGHWSAPIAIAVGGAGLALAGLRSHLDFQHWPRISAVRKVDGCRRLVLQVRHLDELRETGTNAQRPESHFKGRSPSSHVKHLMLSESAVPHRPLVNAASAARL